MAKDKDNINPLCKKCLRDCKQNKDIKIIDCQNFLPQLEFNFKKINKKSAKQAEPVK